MTSATPGPPSSPCVRLLNSHAPAGVPDEVRLRMSRAVPSSAATHSAARRGGAGFVSSILSTLAAFIADRAGLFDPAWPRSPGSDLERPICRIGQVLECANFLKPCLKRRPCRSNGIATGQELLGGLSMPAIFTRASPSTTLVTPSRHHDRFSVPSSRA